MSDSFPVLDLALQRAVVIDGAMGTEIQKLSLTSADYGPVDGLNEMLVLHRPDVIASIHQSFLDAGADIIETNSFSANRIVLADHGIPDMAAQLSKAAAEIARDCADRCSTSDRPRFVSGSVGPGSRLVSLGQIEPELMLEAYREQGIALLAGGVDLFQVETCQDPLQARLACVGLAEAMDHAGRSVPIFAQMTVDAGGKMLGGTDIAAAFATISALPSVRVFGLNCSTGPDSMYNVLKTLSRIADIPLVALPNAGLPENDKGRLVYRLSPADFARQTASFVTDCGVSFVGGCCGTAPEHIRELVDVAGRVGAARKFFSSPGSGQRNLSSLFSATSLVQEPRPLIIGESTNANGSRAFREFLRNGDLEGMLEVGRAQVEEGAHVLDICLAAAGRDEQADVDSFVPLAARYLDVPLMIDSTDPAAIERALRRCPGRPIVNSVNLEDGGARLDTIASAARRHGAAIVALTIDETGMAMTAAHKLDIAARLVNRLTSVHGIPAGDILIDPLTFTLASGDSGLRSSAVETIGAIRGIRESIPDVLVSLGVSNCSYGLKPGARRVLNSVMLHECLSAGLNAAIVNAGRIMPMEAIPVELRQAARDLVWNRQINGRDPLEVFMDLFSQGDISGFDRRDSGADLNLSPADRCRKAIIRGEKTGLTDVLAELRAVMEPVDIINTVLLDAMKQVGVMFADGRMQLPFVLRSAGAMKAAVDILTPELQRSSVTHKGTLVLATVAGDVHDIGKNLVDIIVSNNGYRVVNLGIKQTVDAIMDSARAENADAVGMSGLLVKSTVVMRENLAAMDRAGFSIPVLVGGAALDRSFVESELATVYGGPVVYCRDAFDGLVALDRMSRPGELK